MFRNNIFNMIFHIRVCNSIKRSNYGIRIHIIRIRYNIRIIWLYLIWYNIGIICLYLLDYKDERKPKVNNQFDYSLTGLQKIFAHPMKWFVRGRWIDPVHGGGSNLQEFWKLFLFFYPIRIEILPYFTMGCLMIFIFLPYSIEIL